MSLWLYLRNWVYMTNKGRYTALLDANVLYPAAMRDVFMEVALAKLYRPKWTRHIHQEWIGALLRNKPHLKRDKLERTQTLMDSAIPTALVTGYESLIEAMRLPDSKDRHVVAAAIVGHCDVIVTQNLRDFPDKTMKPLGIEVQHPDEFLTNHLDLGPDRFCKAVSTARLGRKNPPYTVDEYLSNLTQIGLAVTVAKLKQNADLLD